jgi:hypothetical protein
MKNNGTKTALITGAYRNHAFKKVVVSHCILCHARKQATIMKININARAGSRFSLLISFGNFYMRQMMFTMPGINSNVGL